MRHGQFTRVIRALNSKLARPITPDERCESRDRYAARASHKLEQLGALLIILLVNKFPEPLNELVVLLAVLVESVGAPVVLVDLLETANQELKEE